MSTPPPQPPPVHPMPSSSTIFAPTTPVLTSAATRDGPNDFDQLIVNSLHTFDPLSIEMAPVLLLVIVKHASDRLDTKYINFNEAEKLILNKPELFDLLRSAWGTKTFGSILALPILQKKPSSQSLTVSAHDSITPQIIATRKAWTAKYVGSSHVVLRNTINKMASTSKGMDYSNFVAIIQSSGTGKSRAVHEMTNFIFTLPFCLRQKGTTGFPEADANVRDFLAIKGGSEPLVAQEVLDHYCRFFTALFRNVQNALVQINPFPDGPSLAESWRQFLEGHVKGDEGPSQRALLYDATVKASADILSSETALEHEMVVAADSLCSSITTKNKDWSADPKGPICFLMYFDEADVLTNPDIIVNNRTLYHTLCRVLNILKSVPIFNLFLSTNSSLTRFAPPGHLHPSARAHNIDSLQAPFTELLFDCLPDGKACFNITMNLNDVSAVEYMVKFGRPLFWTRYQAGGTEVKNNIIHYACAKLTGVDVPNVNHLTILTDAAKFAILSTRILLELEPARDAARIMEDELIKRNMRIAYSVPLHREYVRSGTPSEPILAEAARSMMHAIDPPNELAKSLDLGLVSKGKMGELVARLLLTLAFDAAFKTCSPGKAPAGPVPLLSFLKALFPEAAYEEILTCEPDNVAAGGSLKETFNNAFIRFTHFAKFDEEVSSYSALAALARGMGIQCYHHQKQIDIVIPFVLGIDGKSGDECSLAEQNVSAILISVKDCKGKADVFVDAEAIDFFPDPKMLPNDTRPYIVLTMELGLINYEVPVKVSKLVRRSPRLLSPQHARYVIHAHGCGPRVYKEATNEGQWAALLVTHNLLSEHPRQDEENIDAIRRMKPSWAKRGGLWYDWIEKPAGAWPLQ